MLEIKNITKRYHYQKVIDHLSMTLPDTGLIAIVGPSGCGKTTLLHIIGGIDKKYQGQIMYQGQRINYHKTEVGFLFQQFHLISWLKIKDNIHLPRFFCRKKYPSYKHSLDISSHYKQYVYSLSLGQRQRVAFLRAMSFYPRFLLCDEPTASLDQKHATEIMELLKEESMKRLVIFVSHDRKLVERYSDEIYEMKDGQITDHIKINETKQMKPMKYQRRMKKSKMILSLIAMKENKTRMIQMFIGLFLSLSTILMTLSLSQGFHQQLKTYIESIVPTSSISFRLKSHQSLTIDQLNDFQQDHIIHSHLYLDQYELLGIGHIEKRYKSQDVLSIYDDSGYVKKSQLLYGRMFQNDFEIILSKTSALHYMQSQDIESLLDQQVMIWFKNNHKVKGAKVKIVGIMKDHDDMDRLYYKPKAYIKIVESLFNDNNIQGKYGLLYVRDSKKDIIKLRKNHRDYEFKEVGKSTKDSIDSFMEKVKYVLLAFSLLAVLSSVFLIGEVMFLEVMCKRKDIAIMKCFQATQKDIFCFIFYQSFLIYIFACLSSFSFFIVFQKMMNTFFQKELLVDIPLISFDLELFFYVYCIGFILLFFSQLIPLVYALKVNTVDSLKKNS